MSRIWIHFVATWGIVAGTVFSCQVTKAAWPFLGGRAAGKPNASPAPSAAELRAPQRPAANMPGEKPPAEPLTVLKSGPDHIRVVYHLKKQPGLANVNTASSSYSV